MSIQALFIVDAAVALGSLISLTVKEKRLCTHALHKLSTTNITPAFLREIYKNFGFCNARITLLSLRILFWLVAMQSVEANSVMTISLHRATPLVYQCILMVLALLKAAEIRKSLGYRGLDLLKMIIYDQAVYFFS